MKYIGMKNRDHDQTGYEPDHSCDADMRFTCEYCDEVGCDVCIGHNSAGVSVHICNACLETEFCEHCHKRDVPLTEMINPNGPATLKLCCSCAIEHRAKDLAA